mmetsp:Transcript_120216/g.351314  ORF Transcript_120216/g.351314 Transcript_120216/m.351314 type:complete len:293 (-) Transcript_120216:707-1585(-)
MRTLVVSREALDSSSSSTSPSSTRVLLSGTTLHVAFTRPFGTFRAMRRSGVSSWYINALSDDCNHFSKSATFLTSQEKLALGARCPNCSVNSGEHSLMGRPPIEASKTNSTTGSSSNWAACEAGSAPSSLLSDLSALLSSFCSAFVRASATASMAGLLVGSISEQASIHQRHSSTSLLLVSGQGRRGRLPALRNRRICFLLKSARGNLPVRMKKATRPNEKMSALLWAGRPRTTSGATHMAEPPMPPTCLVRTRARPKSKSFARKELKLKGSCAMMMFVPFKSPWTMDGSRE